MVLEGCKAELSYGAASGIPVVGSTQLMVLTDRHAHHDTPLRYKGVVGAVGRAVPVVGGAELEVAVDVGGGRRSLQFLSVQQVLLERLERLQRTTKTPTNPAVGCHYFPPGLQLPSQPLRGLLPTSLLGEQTHDGCEQFA